jgi:RNA polymerase sigma-70 factor (ECF subfamily)
VSTQRAQLPDDATIAFGNAFWEHLTAEQRAELSGDETLTARLDGAWDAATATWPELSLAPARLGAWIAERTVGARELDGMLAPTTAAELYLACACAGGDETAMAQLEVHYFPLVRASLARMRLPAHSVDEILQGLRGQLLLRHRDGRPGIAGFRGRGALGAWLSVSAVRAACKLLKRGKDEKSDGDAALERLSGSARDVEGQYSKAWSQGAFQRAFAQAMGQLSARDKSLLRLHYLDSVTIDQLGGLYRTHRATAARWLAMARQRLLDGTRAALTADLQIPLADCDSIIQAAQSQLDMTFHRLFATRSH